MRLLSSVCLMSLTAFGVAQAADLPSRKAPIFATVPVASWEGFYAGTLFSFGQARFTASQSVSRMHSASGSNMAALAGYNFKNGAWIYGLEGDLGFSKLSKSHVGVSGSLVAHQAELLDSAHLRARAGYDFGNLLPFAAVGVSYAQGGVRVGEQGAIKTHTGFNAGAGLDWRVELPIIGRSVLRAEYVYDRFGKENYAYDSAQAAIGMRPEAHLFRFGFINVPKNDSWRAPAFDADWSGSYGGFLSGWSHAHVETKSASASQTLYADSALGGIYAGRNLAFGRWIVGLDSAAMLTNMKGTGIVPGTSDALSYRNYYETSLRGRVGYSFGRTLPFFAAGLSNGRSEQAQTTIAKRVNVSTKAWNIGAGFDYMLTERLSTRLEYIRSTSWKDVSLDFNGGMRQSRSTDMVRAGFAWHFH